MLQYLKNFAIKVKIAGFVIPSTIAFGVVMTCLAAVLPQRFQNHLYQSVRTGRPGASNAGGSEAPALHTEKLLDELSATADKKIRNIAILFISIVVAVIIMATVGALIISFLIGKPVQEVADRLENISSGDADLTQRLTVSANDETGKVAQFFNSFLGKLQGIIKKMQNSADQTQY